MEAVISVLKKICYPLEQDNFHITAKTFLGKHFCKNFPYSPNFIRRTFLSSYSKVFFSLFWSFYWTLNFYWILFFVLFFVPCNSYFDRKSLISFLFFNISISISFLTCLVSKKRNKKFSEKLIQKLFLYRKDITTKYQLRMRLTLNVQN